MSRSDFGFSDADPLRGSGERRAPLPRVTESRPPDAFEEGDLFEYGRMLWSRRRLILGGTVVAAVLAAVAATVLPKTYRATATLFIAESKMWTSQAEQKDIPPHKYMEIIRSHAVAGRVIRDLKLDQSYGLNEEKLIKKIDVIPIEGSKLLRVQVEARTATLARDIANAVVARSVELNRSLSSGDAVAADAFVRTQLADASKRYDAAETALRTFNETARLAEVRQQVDTELQLQQELSLRLAEVQRDISRARGSVEAMTTELKGQKKVLDLVKSIGEDPTFKDVVQNASKADLERLLSVQMKSEQVNPLYQEIEPQLVERLGDVAGGTREKETIQASMAASTQRLVTLQQELARKEAEFDRLDTSYSVEQDNYKTLAKKQAEVGLLTQVKDADLQVVDPAVIPTSHIRPNVWVYTALISVIAFVTLALVALVLEYGAARRVAQARPTESRPLPEMTGTR